MSRFPAGSYQAPRTLGRPGRVAGSGGGIPGETGSCHPSLFSHAQRRTGAARHLSLLLLLELSAPGLELPGCRGFWLRETRLLLPFPHRWGKKGPEPTAPTIPEPVQGTGASARGFHSPAVELPRPGAPCSFHSLVRGRTGARRPPLLPFLRRWCYPPGARCSFRTHGGTRCRSPHLWLPQVQCWWRPEEA